MIQRLALLIVAFVFSSQVVAQRPQPISLEGKIGIASDSRLKNECGNEAGTITIGPHTGNSNDVMGDTIFLCINDQILIDSDASTIMLDGDPNPSTPGGVGYAFYSCQPTIEGEDLATVITDPCLLENTLDPNNPIFVATSDDNSGDIQFSNSGVLQTQFNNEDPLLLWFAPITYDELLIVGNASIAQYEEAAAGEPAGPCVDVSIDQAFPVVYLNEVVIADVNAASQGCRGSFQVQGGLSEFDGSAYTISISLDSDPSISGSILSNSPEHGSRVQFNVPQAGTYNIEVSDGKACPASAQVTFSDAQCAPVTFAIPSLNIQPGVTNACVDISVADFNQVVGFQFPLQWDPNILEYAGIMNLNSNLPGFTDSEANFGSTRVANGELSVIWADLVNFQPVTLADDEVIFSICFNAIGQEGECSPLIFQPDGTPPLGAEDENGTQLGFNPINGQVCLSNQPFFLEVESMSETCFGSADASISFDVSGGIPPYNYELVDGSNMIVESGTITTQSGSITFDNPAPGDYQVIVVDSNTSSDVAGAVVASEAFTIEEGLLLGVNVQIQTPILCAGDANGVIQAVISENGFAVALTDEYTLEWRTDINGPVIGTSELLRDIRAGLTYTATVTKGDCSQTASGSFTSPPPLELAILSVDDATCEGVEDGNVSISVVGGNAPDTYSVQWSNQLDPVEVVSQNPAQQGSLAPGIYSMTATDANGCEAMIDFDVAAMRTIAADAVVSDVSCFAGEDGRIEVSASAVGQGESLPYSFIWVNNLDSNSLPQDTETTSTVDSLTMDTYILIVTDDAGCRTSDTLSVAEPEELVVMVTDRGQASCAGDLSDGFINVEASGGTPTYTYTWPSIAGLTTANATGLGPGSYNVVVTDANGCTAENNAIFISAPDLPSVSVQDDMIECFNGTDGQVSALGTPGSSGAAIVSYAWSNGDTGQMTSDDLPAGAYVVTVTDANDCPAVDTAFVIQPDPFEYEFSMAQDPTCPDFADGRVFLAVSGGTGPYFFDNLQDTLPAGENSEGGFFFVNLLGDVTYNFQITDATNCPGITVDTILTNPPRAEAIISAIDSTSCHNSPDGRATAMAVFEDGASGLFNFAWVESGFISDNTTSSTATNLPAGLNTLNISYIRETSQCSFDTTFVIPAPEPLTPIASAMGVSCFGDTDGNAEIITTGGSAPYRYNWDGGGSGSRQTGLTSGTYSVTVTDANDCVTQIPLTITEPALLELVLDTTRNVSCQGDSDGLIGVSVLGGNPLGLNPFTWPNGVAGTTDSLATDLAPGTYEITVTDQNDCVATVQHFVEEPDAITAIIPTPDEPECFGLQTLIEVMAVFGGSGNSYTFSVNNQRAKDIDEVFTEFGGQEHLISVFDVLGCRFDTTIFIDQPPPIEVNLPEMIEIQLGEDTRLRPDVFSALPIDSIVWTPNDSLSMSNILTPVVNPIDDQTYTLVVVDENGCQGRGSVLVNVDKKRNVYVPNAFSPDLNGFNDLFQVFTGTGVTGISTMRIYDRWGELLYSADNLPPSPTGSEGWDGTFKGKPAPQGVYVYLIEVEFLDGIKLLYRGDVTLMW